jgi:hypothetical protein
MLLERLFINVPYEGYDCLDEVAWRRGLDCRQLLVVLEEAIAVGCHCERPQQPPKGSFLSARV